MSRKNNNKRGTGKDYESNPKKNTKGKYDRGKRDDSERRFMNDPNYYYTDKVLMDQLCSFSFDQFIGIPVDLNATGESIADHFYKVPSIMKIQMNPSIGFTPKEFAKTAGVNLAGFQLYTLFSSKNAKTTNYAPQDITTLLLALGNLIAYIGFLRRAFGTAYLANVRNRDVPREIFGAYDIDYADFVKNLAAYRIRFNTILTTLQSIPFPANIAYFAKCDGLFSHIWMDDNSAMSQMFITKPYSIWAIDEVALDEGTLLKTTKIPSGTMNQHLNFLEELANTLFSSTTLNYIYSDILNVAGKENIPMYKFGLVPEDYVEMPIYNEYMCNMFHNMTIVGRPGSIQNGPYSLDDVESAYTITDENNVYPDPNSNCLYYNPIFGNFGTLSLRAIVDYAMDNPDMDYRIESMRLCAIGNKHYESAGEWNLYSEVTLPDWYVTEVTVIIPGNADVDIHSGEITSLAYDALSAVSVFKNAPRIHIVGMSVTDDGIDYSYVTSHGALNYFTTVDWDYLQKMFDASMLSLMKLR